MWLNLDCLTSLIWYLSVFGHQQTPGHTPAHTPSNSRWDETPGRPKGSETPGATPSTRMWDPTPSHTPAGAATPGRDTPGHATPGHGGATGSVRKNRWDETPKTERETPGHGSGWAETPRTDRGDESVGETPTPGASKRKSRWDETPASQMGSSTPLLTPGKTPIGTPAMNMATPTPGKRAHRSRPSYSLKQMLGILWSSIEINLMCLKSFPPVVLRSSDEHDSRAAAGVEVGERNR